MASNTWDADFYTSKHNFVTNYGESVVELLAPQAGELILDLGCGAGELTAKIATSGAKVCGIDFAAEMISKAQAKFPELEFKQHNAELAFPFEESFDAVFSNAALHWMINAEAVIKNVAQSLKPGGRFVFEMGGKDNVAAIIQALERAADDFSLSKLAIYNYFPSISEYSSILERNGLRVKLAVLFERPTLLDGEDGLRNWIKMFRNSVLDKLEPSVHEQFLAKIEHYGQAKLLRDQQWFADYVRLRMIAIKE